MPDGWRRARRRSCTDAALADAANAAALKEYEFTDGALGEYKRGGETLSLRALRFHDASGAYRRLFVLPAEWLAQGRDRHGRDIEPQPVLFWVGQHA